MLTGVVVLWIAVLPLLTLRGSFEGVKVLWYFGGCSGIFVFWALRILRQGKDLSFSKADLFYLLWLLTLFLSSLFGIHPFKSIIGGSYRHQGIIFFLGLWFIKKTLELLNNKGKQALYKSIGFVAVAEALIVLFQVVSGRLYLGKPLGTLGEANAVAGYLAMGSYFILESFPRLLIVVPFISVFLTWSRAGVLAILPVSGILLKNVGQGIKKITVISVAAASLLIVVFISLSKSDSVFESRPLIWKLGVVQVFQKPILGYGAESGEAVYNEAFVRNEMPLSMLVIDRAHNLFLDVAMWSGTLGLAFFCGWLYLGHKSMGTNKKFALYSFFVYSMFQPLSVVHWVLLAVILGTD